MATISKENYLKAIYGLTAKNRNLVSFSDLAKELCISNAAISEMASRLADQGFVEYKKYRGVKLLPKGKKIAVNVIRKHRIWELFLIKTLNISWDEVHQEAEYLEHFTSDFLIDKIDEHLNFPEADPHGAPIPNKNGDYRGETENMPMERCEMGKSYRIARVNDKNPELMRYLSQIKISLNKKVKISNKIKFDSSIIIQVDEQKHSLSEKAVKNIYVSEI